MNFKIVDCADCVFWVPHFNSEMGDCRRHAPRLIEAMANLPDADPDEQRWALWPQTFIEHGCGDGVCKPRLGLDGQDHEAPHEA